MATDATAAEGRMIMATEFNTQVGNGEYRLQFETNNEAHYLLMQSAARRCIDRAHMTNADRIRAMSDAQLVQMLTIGRGGFSCSKCEESEDCGQNCEIQCLKWLQRPAEVTK